MRMQRIISYTKWHLACGILCGIVPIPFFPYWKSKSYSGTLINVSDPLLCSLIRAAIAARISNEVPLSRFTRELTVSIIQNSKLISLLLIRG
jgi:hypothetical protein